MSVRMLPVPAMRFASTQTEATCANVLRDSSKRTPVVVSYLCSSVPCSGACAKQIYHDLLGWYNVYYSEPYYITTTSTTCFNNK